MKDFNFTIPLTPTTQQRVRVGKFGGYKTKSQRLSESKIIYHMEQHRQTPLIDGAIILEVICYFQRPQKHFRKTKGVLVQKEDAPYYYTQTPDWDNIGKQISDCGNGIIWKDDKYIADGRVVKVYSSKNEPKIIVNVSCVKP